MSKPISYNSEFLPEITIAVIFSDSPQYEKLTSFFKEYGYGFLVPNKNLVVIDGENIVDNFDSDVLKFIEAHEIAHIILGHDGPRNDEEEMDEETIYEIEIDDEDEEGDVKEVEATEAIRTFGTGVRGPAQKKTYKAGRHEMNEEVEKLKKQNSEYKKALVLFKDKLNEVAVFNSNLAYATRLFTEHSTTKQEKINILRRFDGTETIKESKTLYKVIKDELSNKNESQVVKESVEVRINRTPSTGAVNLIESKTYENPQFLRMKDIMNKLIK